MDADSSAPALRPLALEPLPLGRIRPTGWLETQLRIQADGLSGHLDEFWPDIAESGWIGGSAEGWERAPYWLDGLVPLAYLLEDEDLIDKVRRWMDYILDHQADDGWLGPDTCPTGKYEPHDPWPQFIILKALLQHEQASGSERVLPAVLKCLHRLDALLDEKPLYRWSQSRWADLVWTLHRLHDRTGEAWLLALADKAHAQGYDWRGHFEEFPCTEKVTEGFDQPTHVVNNAMAVKAPGVWYRQSGDDADRRAVYRAIDVLDTHHGQASGMFSGDEHLAGRSPTQGTELCAVVEYMYSLECLSAILGDAVLGDWLEQIAFNALPATFKPDMWAHQYVQQANQVQCRVSEDRVYTNNGPDANVFGLAPNYGCCTANMHQGWPKLASHLWMRSPDGGLAAVAYAPCELSLEIDGAKVHVIVKTRYPFGREIEVTVEASRSVEFPLHLRVPSWAGGAELRVDDGKARRVPPGQFARVKRRWGDKATVTLRVPLRPRALKRDNGAVTIHRGPLTFALKIDEHWHKIGGEEPHADWEVYPLDHWNYALHLDPDRPEDTVHFEARGVGDEPFSVDGTPVRATVQGRMVPHWTLHRNAAADPPPSPVSSYQQLVDLELIPYGCTNLRISEFPVLDE